MLPQVAAASDWPSWRGPTYNGVSTDTGLVEKWDPAGGPGSNLIWKSTELAGRSTPAVFAGKLYTICRHKPGTELEAEKVVCADALTGKVLWEHVFNVYLSDVPDTRVGWANASVDPETGNVYAQGVCGYFCCLDGKSGEVLWDRSLHEEFGFLSTYGGRTNSPVVYQDTVITSAVVISWGDTPAWGMMAKPSFRLMAFDKRTGEMRWLSSTDLIPNDTTYSGAALVHLKGQDLLIFGSGEGKIWAMQAGTGKPVWNYPISRRGVNTPPTVGPDGRVYVGHSEENIVGNTMGLFASLDGARSGPQKLGDELWLDPESMVGRCAPLLIEGRVYTLSDFGKMVIYDAATGKELERKTLGRTGRGSPVYADGKIYCCTNEGMYYTLLPDAKRLKILAKVRLNQEEVNSSPVIADGRIYISSNECLYCIGDPGKAKPGPNSPQTPPAPTGPAGAPGPVAQVQVVPWEALVEPGQEQPYRVRLYDANGRYLRDAKAGEAIFSVVGPGKVDPEGMYQAPADATFDGAMIVCKVGEITGQGRARIVPPLPWKFDFTDSKDVPFSWVQGRVRYVVRESAGEKYIAKPVELPTKPGAPTTKLGTRSQMWMGQADLAGYTMQADVQLQTGLAGEADDAAPRPEGPAAGTVASAIKMPDIGLINSRYVFSLFGQSQEARLYSWCTHDKRTQAVLKMKLEPHVWYTLKLRVEPDMADKVARVYGKVWPRDAAEPQEWTLEITDRSPNYQGSPGLFGSSIDAEIFIDNISVTPN